MRLILVTLLFRYGLSGAVENPVYSAHCQKCIEPCLMEPETEIYKCKTDDWFKKGKNNVTDWDFCSLSETTNHKGYNCTNECDFNGKDFQWCKDKYHWGYCSGPFCKPDHGFSAHCHKCTEPCVKDPETKMYKCKTNNWSKRGTKNVTDWDFCSPSDTKNHHGADCTNECAFHGKDYQWCKDEIDWGYCSSQFCKMQQPDLTVQSEPKDYGYSAHCQKCIGPCEKNHDNNNYSCKTKKWYNKRINNNTEWDFCSPSETINHHGNNCTNECDFHGKIYKWCDDEYYWGYCSAESCTTDHGYSAHCKKCIEPCKMGPEEEEYSCKTSYWDNTRSGEVMDWEVCSPSVNQTHTGGNCTNERAFHGEDYQWCLDTGGRKGLCSGESCTSEKKELPDYGYSAHCQMCIEPCDKEPESRKYKCKTSPWENFWTQKYTDWDWCSPSKKQNHHGADCTNECDFHENKDYKWCTDEYKWGYCSGQTCTLAKPEDNGYSVHCKKCHTPCKIDLISEEYKCKTEHFYNTIFKNATDWDWCSPSEKHNHWGDNCTGVCAFYGEEYQKCLTADLHFAYCSGKFCTLDQEPDYGYSSYCQKCIQPCNVLKRYGQTEYWCSTQKWIKGNETYIWEHDFCSPDSRVDWKGRLCKDKCAFKGKDYQWCEVDVSDDDVGDNRIGYCSGKGNVLCDFIGNTYAYVDKKMN